jgi:uncharacterized iron-regulated membrane protein
LLIGTVGNRLVELAACWAIVMIVSGLYLWWPRGRRLAGVVWPRLRLGKRAFWRDLHAVTGFWVSSLALVMLLSGLPWAGVWGPAFAAVRAELGWVKGPAQWAVDGTQSTLPADAHQHHHHGGASAAMPTGPFNPRVFDQMVSDARAEHLAFPAIVTPPGAPGRFNAPGQMLWTIRSDTDDPPLRTTIRYDLTGHSELSRERFKDSHPIDRAIAYGVAWHEGQLFGWLNQLIGLVTALGLVTLAVSGAVMWLKRRPVGTLGAPAPAPPMTRPGLVTLILLLALLLPLFALSVGAIWVTERLLLRHWRPFARWFGLRPEPSA